MWYAVKHTFWFSGILWNSKYYDVMLNHSVGSSPANCENSIFVRGGGKCRMFRLEQFVSLSCWCVTCYTERVDGFDLWERTSDKIIKDSSSRSKLSFIPTPSWCTSSCNNPTPSSNFLIHSLLVIIVALISILGPSHITIKQTTGINFLWVA